jgi:hypothetical protein
LYATTPSFKPWKATTVIGRDGLQVAVEVLSGADTGAAAAKISAATQAIRWVMKPPFDKPVM